MEETKVKIRAFLSGFFRTAALKDSDDIFALGFVNSLFAMQLVAWLEQSFAITISDEDLDIRNFNSIDALAAFVGRKIPAEKEASTPAS